MTKRLFKLKEILKHIYQDYQLDWIGLYRIMSNVDHVEKGLVKEVFSILMKNMLLGLYRRNESICLSTHYRLYLKEYSDVHRDDRTSFLFGWHSRPYQTICILFHDSNESIVYFAKYPYSIRILHFAHLFYIFLFTISPLFPSLFYSDGSYITGCLDSCCYNLSIMTLPLLVQLAKVYQFLHLWSN